MENFEKHDEIRLPEPTAELPVAPASYFRAAEDLCATEAPPPAPRMPEPVMVQPPKPPVQPTPHPAPEVKRPDPVPAAPKAELPGDQKPEDLQKPRKKGSFWKTAVAAVLVLALVAGSCVITGSVLNRRWEEQYQQMSAVYSQQMRQLQKQIDENAKPNESTGESVTGSPVAVGDGLTPSQVYAQNVNAVVAVQCTVGRGAASGTSMGSGFIITADGYVGTNYHVIEDATEISVITHDGSTYSAEVVGYDDTNDVAVLKVEGKGLPFVTIGSSDDLIVGDQVVAIGNPLGELTNTLTVGYVSAKERDVTTDGITINMLQTDAAINSGNSGGPLFNMRGEVVGITTAKYSGESSSGATIEGIGFAIPMDDVYDLIEDLMVHGYVTGAYLGVMVSEMNAESAEYYGLPLGAYVQEVTPGYAAEAAGVQEKDIIVALGTYEVRGLNSLTRALRNFEPGETTTLTVFRSGEEIVLTITLDEKPREEVIPTGSGEMPEDGSYEEWYEYFKPFFGNGND